MARRQRIVVPNTANAQLMTTWPTRPFRRAGSSGFSVALVGLSTDSIGLYGQIGNQAAIGFTTTPVITPDEIKWSASVSTGAAATFGTGANPTDFSAADGSFVYLHVRSGANWVTRSFIARRAPGAFAALVNQTFTDNTGNQIYTFAAATGAGLTWAYTLVTPPVGVTINSGTRVVTFDTNAMAVQSGTVITVRAADQYGRTIDRTFTLTINLPAQATGGPDLDLSFPEDIAITPTNLIANWTLNGNTLSFFSISPPLPSGLSINTSGVLSGTPTTVTADATYTLTMVDTYSRQTSDNFTLQITIGAINPSLTGLTFADPGDGVPDELTATYSYFGGDTLRAFVAIRNGGSPLTPTQLRDGTGTFLERVVVNPFSATTFDLTGFTSVSDAGTAIDMAIAEVTNGGISAAQTVAVTGLDFTRPVFSSAQATNANTVVVTFSQPIFGTGISINWSFNINGSPASVTAAVVSGSTVSLTVSDTMVNGQVLNALAYVPGDLDDQDGNQVLAFSGQSITNSIPAAGFVLDALTGIQSAYSTRRLRTAYTGPLIRVRRSSDNAETNIGYDGSGNLDTVALLAFVGANSAFMTTIYDQSGNGLNLVSAGVGNSPRVVNAGTIEVIGTRPSPFYDGGDRMGSATGLTLTINTINAVVLRNTTTTNAVIMAAAAQGGGEAAHLRYNTSFAYNTFKGAASITAGTLPASRTVITAVGQDAGSARIFGNGTQVGVGTAWGTGTTITGTDFMAIGARPSGAVSDTAQAHIPEAIMFSAALTTAERTALESNQIAYYV
jgi:hypothetical protein